MNAPSVEYFLISPMLIVFGAAVLGVLVEAFLPRRLRYRSQIVLALGGLGAAFVAVVLLARDLHGSVGQVAVMGAVAVDPAALFLQGTILLVSVLGILLIAERRISSSGHPAESKPQQAVWMLSHRRRRPFPAASPRRPPSKPAWYRPRCSR